MPFDYELLRDLAWLAEGWLSEIQSMINQRDPIVQEFATWVGDLNQESSTVIFRDDAHYSEVMDRNFGLAASLLSMVCEEAQKGNHELANELKEESNRELAELLNRAYPGASEVIYKADTPPPSGLVVTNITEEVKRYFAKHPEKLHSLHPRKFEELICDILKDLGFETELTKATRDGGWDIYARMKNEITTYLMLVECKRYALDKLVGPKFVRELAGVCGMHKADRGMIVTTSYFSKRAEHEKTLSTTQMVLADFERLKEFLQPYK